MAPRLADGVLIGIVLTIILYLMGNMSPRSEIMGIKKDGTLAGAASHDLPPVSENFVVMRFDSSLVFVNVAHFEYAVMDAIRYFPNAKAILILGKGINKIDASGEVKLRTLIEDLNSIGVTVAMAGLKSQLLESFEKTGLDEFIGKENIFRDTKTGIQELKEKYGLAQDIIKKIIKDGIDFEAVATKFSKLKPSFIVDIYYGLPGVLKKKYDLEIDMSLFAEILLEKLNSNEITKDALEEIVVKLSKGDSVNYDNYKPLALDDIKEDVKSIVNSMREAPRGAIMGKVMAKYKGKVDGQELSKFIDSLF